MKIRSGMLAAALVAAVASPAWAADPVVYNFDGCGGSLFSTCASVTINSLNTGPGEYAITMTVANPVGNNSNFAAIGLHHLPAGTTATFVSDDNGDWTFSDNPNGLNGQGIMAVVQGESSDHGNSTSIKPGESLTFTFTLSGVGSGSDYAFDDFAIHGISGPNGCSTKLVVTDNQANQGPFDERCGDVPETVVPEPASVVLMATGLLALVGGGAVRNRRKRHEV